MKFNEKLKILRIEKNLTQEQLASKLNIARQSISKWEQGINEPSIETIKKLCLILGVSIETLIDVNNSHYITKETGLLRKDKFLYIMNICIFLINSFILVIFLRFMDDTIPVHYDSNFQVDRYGSK